MARVDSFIRAIEDQRDQIANVSPYGPFAQAILGLKGIISSDYGISSRFDLVNLRLKTLKELEPSAESPDSLRRRYSRLFSIFLYLQDDLIKDIDGSLGYLKDETNIILELISASLKNYSSLLSVEYQSSNINGPQVVTHELGRLFELHQRVLLCTESGTPKVAGELLTYTRNALIDAINVEANASDPDLAIIETYIGIVLWLSTNSPLVDVFGMNPIKPSITLGPVSDQAVRSISRIPIKYLALSVSNPSKVGPVFENSFGGGGEEEEANLLDTHKENFFLMEQAIKYGILQGPFKNMLYKLAASSFAAVEKQSQRSLFDPKGVLLQSILTEWYLNPIGVETLFALLANSEVRDVYSGEISQDKRKRDGLSREDGFSDAPIVVSLDKYSKIRSLYDKLMFHPLYTVGSNRKYGKSQARFIQTTPIKLLDATSNIYRAPRLDHIQRRLLKQDNQTSRLDSILVAIYDAQFASTEALFGKAQRTEDPQDINYFLLSLVTNVTFIARKTDNQRTILSPVCNRICSFFADNIQGIMQMITTKDQQTILNAAMQYIYLFFPAESIGVAINTYCNSLRQNPEQALEAQGIDKQSPFITLIVGLCTRMENINGSTRSIKGDTLLASIMKPISTLLKELPNLKDHSDWVRSLDMLISAMQPSKNRFSEFTKPLTTRLSDENNTAQALFLWTIASHVAGSNEGELELLGKILSEQLEKDIRRRYAQILREDPGEEINTLSQVIEAEQRQIGTDLAEIMSQADISLEPLEKNRKTPLALAIKIFEPISAFLKGEYEEAKNVLLESASEIIQLSNEDPNSAAALVAQMNNIPVNSEREVSSLLEGIGLGSILTSAEGSSKDLLILLASMLADLQKDRTEAFRKMIETIVIPMLKEVSETINLSVNASRTIAQADAQKIEALRRRINAVSQRTAYLGEMSIQLEELKIRAFEFRTLPIQVNGIEKALLNVLEQLFPHLAPFVDIDLLFHDGKSSVSAEDK